MRSLLLLFVAATLLQALLALASESPSRYGQECSLDFNNACGTNEQCFFNTSKKTGKCNCVQYYEYIGGECIKVRSTEAPTNEANTPKPDYKPTSSSEQGNSVAAILLVPTCLVIIGALVYFGARRYKWIQRFRQFRQNRYGSVLVTRDDTDDDDPPIA